MKIGIVCIAKDEEYYINEWIEYYKKLGFDGIHMYENDWESGIDDPYVTKVRINGKHKQMEAYWHYVNTYRNRYDWTMVIDCDEFLVLNKHKSITDFIEEYNNPYGIGVNWQYFGPNGRMIRGEYPNSLLKQFTKKQIGVDRHIKAILNMNANSHMVLPHNPNTPLMDTNRRYFNGPWNDEGDVNVAQLNHYHHKSYEDWVRRCYRGQSDHTPTKVPEGWDKEKYAYCEVEDLKAHNFLYGESSLSREK